jgi:hypothetical protein
MSIEVRCRCGRRLAATEPLVGRRGSCPYCGAEVHYIDDGDQTTGPAPDTGPRTARLEGSG